MLESLLPFQSGATAMLLAAGRGERMRPLTDHTPKPLLNVFGVPLITRPLRSLLRQGHQHVLINTGWLGDQINTCFGDFFHENSTNKLAITYSKEYSDFGYALETAGGIVRALPKLSDVFWVAAGDVFSPDFCFSWDDFIRFKESPDLAHLWLVANPDHNLKGDFGLVEGRATLLQDATPASQRYTFSTIALYRKAFFHSQWCDLPEGNPQGVKAALAPMLRQAISMGLVGASLYQGTWVDVGTPERLAQIGLMDCRA